MIAIVTNVGYFEFVNNVLGFIIEIMWIVLALIRFAVYYLWLEALYCDFDGPIAECSVAPISIQDSCPPAADDPCYRNTFTTSFVVAFTFDSFAPVECLVYALLPPRIVHGAVVHPVGIALVSYCNFITTEQTCGTFDTDDYEYGAGNCAFFGDFSAVDAWIHTLDVLHYRRGSIR